MLSAMAGVIPRWLVAVPFHFPLPKSESTDERVGVVSLATTRWQLLEILDVASAQDNVIQLKCRNEAFYVRSNRLAPFFLTQSLEPAKTEVVFGNSLSIVELAQFQGHDVPTYDQRRAEPRTEPPGRASSRFCSYPTPAWRHR